MRRRQVLALLGVGVTEGCLRLAQDTATPTRSPDRIGSPTDSPTATESPTAQPAPTPYETDSPEPTDSPTPTPDLISQVEGLTETGVTEALAETHQQALREVPFQTAWHDENTTTGEVTMDRTWQVADGTARSSWTNQGPLSVYLAEEGYWREELDGGVTYGNHRKGYQHPRVVRTHFVRQLINGGDWAAPTLIEEPPPGLFRIVAVGVDDPEPLVEEFTDGTGSAESYTADGRVDGRGIIHRLDVNLEMRTGDGTLEEWHIELRWDPAPDLTVSAPSWYSTAKAQAPEVSARLSDDRKYLVWEFTAGNDMKGPLGITLYDKENRRNEAVTGVEADIQAGEPIYCYHEGDGVLQLSSGSRPSGASPVTLDASSYAFWAAREPDGLEYFFIGEV